MINLYCYTDSKKYNDYHHGKRKLHAPDDYLDVVTMSFNACFKEKNNDPYSDWDEENRLDMTMRDFDMMIREALFPLFPIIDPDSGAEIDQFDYTSFNEISRDNWIQVITTIKGELMPKAVKKELLFYESFLQWMEKALETASIIVVDGGL